MPAETRSRSDNFCVTLEMLKRPGPLLPSRDRSEIVLHDYFAIAWATMGKPNCIHSLKKELRLGPIHAIDGIYGGIYGCEDEIYGPDLKSMESKAPPRGHARRDWFSREI